jgi:hypothetical protein
MRTPRTWLLVTITMVMCCASIAGRRDEPPVRPRDPWVFRCVLDQRARMVVINPRDDLWLAYDATTCSLHKVWKGDVKFDGAVYTTVHGPQPTSRGSSLLPTAPPEKSWRVEKNGAPVAFKAEWKGYAFEQDRVWLKATLKCEDGAVIEVSESPEFVVGTEGALHLVRQFRRVQRQDHPNDVFIAARGDVPFSEGSQPPTFRVIDGVTMHPVTANCSVSMGLDVAGQGGRK